MPLFNRLSIFTVLVCAACTICLLTSCKKYVREEQYPASLTIVNALNDNTTPFYIYFGEDRPKLFLKLQRLYSGNFLQYGTEKREQPVSLFLNADTLAKDQPAITNRLPLEEAGIYTHFIYGGAGQFKTKTVKENIPGFSMYDSVTNLRVVNFFENRSIDVIQILPTVKTLATDVKYEEITSFQKLPFTNAVTNFRFEIRDHATGTVLTTFYSPRIDIPGSEIPRSEWLYRSRTLSVSGKWNNTSSFNAAVAAVNHF